MPSTLIKTVMLDAPRQTVWSFLTDANKLGTWFHESDVDLVPGSAFQLMHRPESGKTGRVCWGEVVTMDPPSLLVHTFTFDALEGAPTKVTWTLEEVFGGTRLTLMHEGLHLVAGDATKDMMMALDVGWDEHLARLRPAVKGA
ncbi:MAG: SRPBCC domain-containing protein [Pseudomonadota bacterium]